MTFQRKVWAFQRKVWALKPASITQFGTTTLPQYALCSTTSPLYETSQTFSEVSGAVLRRNSHTDGAFFRPFSGRPEGTYFSRATRKRRVRNAIERVFEKS